MREVLCSVVTFVFAGAGFAYLAFLLALVFYLGWRVLLGALLSLLVLAASASPAVAATIEDRDRDESALFRALGWGVWAVSAGDVLSTELALSSSPHAYESNPLQRNRWVRVGAHVAYPWSMNELTARYYQREPRKALWVRIAIVAGYGLVTAHNLRQSMR